MRDVRFKDRGRGAFELGKVESSGGGWGRGHDVHPCANMYPECTRRTLHGSIRGGGMGLWMRGGEGRRLSDALVAEGVGS